MDYCDGSGIALLIQLRRLQQKAGGKLEIHGLRPEFQELLDDWSQGSSDTTQSKAKVRVQLVEEIGRGAVQVWEDIHELISFVGQLGPGYGQGGAPSERDSLARYVTDR